MNYANNLSFGSAKDISLKYVLERHSRYLPERMINEIKALLASGEKDLPQLYELHNSVYKPLMEAKTLDEAKRLYPELSDVLEMTTLDGNRSKAVSAVRSKMPLEKFTLEYLKRIYAPRSQESIVKEFGFTMRSLVDWLNSKLNIKKLSGNYLNLIRMSNEKENERIAECSRKAIYANPELQAKRQAKVAEHHRTPEYREKKRQEMINFYKNNPKRAEIVGMISKLTWEKCPEIKEAFSDYTSKLSSYTRSALSKKLAGKRLTAQEQRAVGGYYKNFWETHKDLIPLYKQMRKEAAAEVNSRFN